MGLHQVGFRAAGSVFARECQFMLSLFLSVISQVRLGRNETQPPAPGLEDLFYRYGMNSF